MPATVNVVLDMPLGYRADDPLALGVVMALELKGEAHLAGLSVSTSNLQAAGLALVIRNFYRPPIGIFDNAATVNGFHEAPVGLLAAAKLDGKMPLTSVPLAKANAEGKPVYSHSIAKLTDTAGVVPLIRNSIAAQPDQSVVVVFTGPATNLALFLDLPGSKELVSKRVKSLIMVAGEYPEGAGDFALAADPASARKILAEWPTAIFAVGREVSEAVKFPASSIEKDFSWTPNHPVADAYKAFHAMPYDSPTGALAAALFAVRPGEGYFVPSDPGTIELLADGRTKFTPSVAGRHRYLRLDSAKKAALQATYVELASFHPAPPPAPSRGGAAAGRGRGAAGASGGGRGAGAGPGRGAAAGRGPQPAPPAADPPDPTQ